jgi:hypothetical protein
MTNEQYLVLFVLVAAIGYGVGRLQGNKAEQTAKNVEEMSTTLFNATLAETERTLRENGIEFEEKKFIKGVTRRSGIKIEKRVKEA